MPTNIYYNTVLPDDAPPEDLHEQDLLNLLEYGDLPTWRPLLRALRSEPHGTVALRLERILDLVESPGIAEYFQIKLNRYRGLPLDRLVTVPRPHRDWGI